MSRFEIRLSSSLIRMTFVLMLWPAGGSLQAQNDSLDSLRQQWTELQIQFAKKEAEIASGGENAKQLQTEYRELITQANDLIDRLKTQSLTLLKSNPTDTKTLRQLMGILINDVAKGEEKSVLKIGDELITLGINPIYFETAARADRLSIAGREIFEELLIRQTEAQQDDLPRVELETNKGRIVLELYENQAPNTVSNFIALTQAGHFNDIQFHRVIDGFMAQAGLNKGDGKPASDLDYTIACECYSPDTRRHFSHCVSMALNSEGTEVIRDSGAAQFFITFSRRSRLDGKHTCFGRVIEGAEVLEKIERTASTEDIPIPNVTPDRILSAKVLRKRDHNYEPKKLGKAAETLNSQEPTAPAVDKQEATKSPESGEGDDANQDGGGDGGADEKDDDLSLPGSSADRN